MDGAFAIAYSLQGDPQAETETRERHQASDEIEPDPLDDLADLTLNIQGSALSPLFARRFRRSLRSPEKGFDVRTHDSERERCDGDTGRCRDNIAARNPARRFDGIVGVSGVEEAGRGERGERLCERLSAVIERGPLARQEVRLI